MMLFASLVIGQTIPDRESGLTVRIIPDFGSFDGDGPLVMTINLKNGSNRKVRTEYLPVVILEKVGDVMKPVTVEWTAHGFVRLDPKSSYAKKDHLGAGETAIISVDLHALEWNDPNLSIRGDSKLTGILSPGRYRLSVSMIVTVRENGNKKSERATSNDVYLTSK
jgi:hypothetical protein